MEQHCLRVSSSVRPCSHFADRGSPPFRAFEASQPAMEEAALNQQTDMPYTVPRHREHDLMMHQRSRRRHQRAQWSTQSPSVARLCSKRFPSTMMLEQTSASLQRTKFFDWNLQRTWPAQLVNASTAFVSVPIWLKAVSAQTPWDWLTWF